MWKYENVENAKREAYCNDRNHISQNLKISNLKIRHLTSYIVHPEYHFFNL
jgi:hypothetical protein